MGLACLRQEYVICERKAVGFYSGVEAPNAPSCLNTVEGAVRLEFTILKEGFFTANVSTTVSLDRPI